MAYIIESACMCSIGRVRKNNEDNFYFGNQCLNESNSALTAPLTMSQTSAEGFCVSVFDGMGGENFGECASYAAAQRMKMRLGSLGSSFIAAPQNINELCLDINLAVVERQRELCTERMGSTLVSLHFADNLVYAANLGDSRAYRFRNGELAQLSVDHTENRSGHKKSPLTQHLGINPEEYLLEPYITESDLQTGDLYLICSDGVTDMLEDGEIREILGNCSTCENCVQRLVDAALEKGGVDNTTAILCRVGAQETAAEGKDEAATSAVKERKKLPEKLKNILLVLETTFIVAALTAILALKVIIPAKEYNRAKNMMLAGEYSDAAAAFETLGGYRDSDEKADACRTAALDNQYSVALELMAIGKYGDAATAFEAMDGYKNSATLVTNCKYNFAVTLMDGGEYDKALAIFEELDGYENSTELIMECKYYSAIAYMDAGRYDDAIDVFESLNGYKYSAGLIIECKYKSAIALMNAGQYEEALAVFGTLDGYKDSSERLKECRYNCAIALVNGKQYIAAYEAFELLGDYKDCVKLRASIEIEYRVEMLSHAEVGDVVIFGSYEQDNDKENGKEDIEWIVLAKEDGRVLVISKYPLDYQPYHSENTEVTWGTCSIRVWLNETFLNRAFSSDEQRYILDTEVPADDNHGYGTNAGNSTTDKVFLLSVTEAEKYFHSDEDRKCIWSAYPEYSAPAWFWWLRSPGYSQNCAAAVFADGSIDYRTLVDSGAGCVRPAMWIDISGVEN